MGLTAPVLLCKSHNTDDFDCGQETLNHWLRHSALKNETRGASRTFVVCDAGRVIGYYALASGSISHIDAPGKVRRNMPDLVPVMVLGRLAVDKDFQAKGIGKALLRDALLRVIAISQQAGVKAMLLHALTEEARRFYLRLGFSQSPTNEMTMMVLVKEAMAMLSDE